MSVSKKTLEEFPFLEEMEKEHGSLGIITVSSIYESELKAAKEMLIEQGKDYIINEVLIKEYLDKKYLIHLMRIKTINYNGESYIDQTVLYEVKENGTEFISIPKVEIEEISINIEKKENGREANLIIPIHGGINIGKIKFDRDGLAYKFEGVNEYFRFDGKNYGRILIDTTIIDMNYVDVSNGAIEMDVVIMLYSGDYSFLKSELECKFLVDAIYWDSEESIVTPVREQIELLNIIMDTYIRTCKEL